MERTHAQNANHLKLSLCAADPEIESIRQHIGDASFVLICILPASNFLKGSARHKNRLPTPGAVRRDSASQPEIFAQQSHAWVPAVERVALVVNESVTFRSS